MCRRKAKDRPMAIDDGEFTAVNWSSEPTQEIEAKTSRRKRRGCLERREWGWEKERDKREDEMGGRQRDKVRQEGCSGAEVEMSASMTKSTTCRYEHGCRYNPGNKVRKKKSCYCSMEHHWRRVTTTTTRLTCKYSYARHSGITCIRVRHPLLIEEVDCCFARHDRPQVVSSTRTESLWFLTQLFKILLFIYVVSAHY